MTIERRRDHDNTLGGILAWMRDTAGLTVATAAALLDWSTYDLEQLERNARGVSIAECRGMLSLYGITEREDVETWLSRLPMRCRHQERRAVVLCERCRTVVSRDVTLACIPCVAMTRIRDAHSEPRPDNA